jgi:WS/DGAT/MGAT family acyltransferase
MQRMTGYDAAFIYDERPDEPQHTLKVSIWSPEASAHYSLEGTRRFVAARLPQLPPLRWRVLRVPFDLYHPVCVDDPALDLTFHIRRRALSAPAGRKELCEEVSRIASCPLDPERPLWEMWMLEGYLGDRVVAVLKMSHALADGSASKELLERLYADPTAGGEAGERATGAEAGERATGAEAGASAHPARPLPSRFTLLRDALRDRIRDALVELPRLSRTTHRVRTALRRTPIARIYRGRRISLLSSPKTPFSGRPGRGRSFYFATVPIDEAKAIRRQFDCTLNDVVLATAAGALRGYLREHKALPGLPILAHMPACIRADGEREAFGNRITTRTLSLPTHMADPVERLRAARALAGEAKEDLQRRRGANLEDWLRWLPPVASKGIGYAARLFVRMNPEFTGGVTVSSVPGPRRRLHAPGGSVENLVSVGHVKYVAGLNITVWSYAEQLNFGLYACPSSVPDVARLADHINQSFEELRKAATHEAARIAH